MTPIIVRLDLRVELAYAITYIYVVAHQKDGENIIEGEKAKISTN